MKLMLTELVSPSCNQGFNIKYLNLLKEVVVERYMLILIPLNLLTTKGSRSQIIEEAKECRRLTRYHRDLESILRRETLHLF